MGRLRLKIRATLKRLSVKWKVWAHSTIEVPFDCGQLLFLGGLVTVLALVFGGTCAGFPLLRPAMWPRSIDNRSMTYSTAFERWQFGPARRRSKGPRPRAEVLQSSCFAGGVGSGSSRINQVRCVCTALSVNLAFSTAFEKQG